MRLLLLTLLLAARVISAQEQPPACPFGPGDLPTTTHPGGLHGAQIPIDHVVVLMQENRSFDHYFSHLPGQRVRGVSNPDPLGGPPITPFRQTRLCEVADLAHSWNASHREWNGGAMDGFTAENTEPEDPSGARAMGYYKRKDIPYYYKLYRTFAMSNRHFCSLLGPTWPNRHFLLAGTAFGHKSNDAPTSNDEFSQRTIFEVLDEGGISWKVYSGDLAFALVYAYVRNQRQENLHPIADFYTDAADGTLPQVTFVDPMFFGEEQSDEHPPSNVQIGQRFVAGIVDAVMQSSLWPSLALFITYDEHGGYWDHVPPPLACVPDEIPPALGPNDVPGAYDRYGIRVPFLVVSPFARRRYVSHTVTDQTSILKFIETRFDLPALTRRDANAEPLLEMFNFENPRYLTPPPLPAAVVDPVRSQECPGGSPSGAFVD